MTSSSIWTIETDSGFEFKRQPQIAYVGPNTEYTSLEDVTRVLLPNRECVPINEDDVERAESNSIYYSRVCRFDQHKSRIKSALMHFDFESNESRLIQQFAFFNGFNRFAIEPEGSRIVFVLDAGFLSDTAYVILPDASQDVEDSIFDNPLLVSNYRSIRGLDWTDRGITVLADGKGQGPDTDLDKIIGSKVDLLLIDPDSGSVTVLFKGLEEARSLRWSPDGSTLAFGARIDGEDGVWLFDPETEEVRSIWPEMALFDWSPDGGQMVLLHTPERFGYSKERRELPTVLNNHPVIIDIE